MSYADPPPTAADAVEASLAAVQAELDTFLSRQRDMLRTVSSELAVVGDLALTAFVGGKRLRPLFCYWGARAAGGRPDDPGILRSAAALELLQAAALVHDDVIDGSDTRRERPAAHRHLEVHHRRRGWSGDAERFGVGAAILVGDLFLVWSDQLFSASGLGGAALERGRRLFDLMRTEVMAGQYLDIVAQSLPEPDPEVIATVLRYKSARYSVERPLQIGAALAGGSDALIGALSDFGLPVGEAFQLRDDLLGVFGDPRITGKPSGDDLREGKRTMLVAHAFANGDDSQRELLTKGLGATNLDPAGVEALRTVLRDTGAVAAVELQIEQRRTAALRALRALPVDPPTRDALRTLAGAAIDRDR